MAKITRIKAGDEPKSDAKKPKTKTSAKKVTKKVDHIDKKALKKAEKLAKKAKKAEKAEKPTKNPIRLLARYFKHSWAEIREVRWPNRATTWKMVLAVLVYTALLVVLITLLDMLFTFIFNKLLG